MPTFRIDPEASRVWIDANSSVHPIKGEASGVEGFLELAVTAGVATPAGPQAGLGPAKARAALDAAAETTDGSVARIELAVDRLRSGNPLYDSELRRIVESRRYPLIVGEVTTWQAADQSARMAVSGDLTFHGVTCPAHGEVTIEVVDDETVVVKGEHTFDITDFGVRPPRLFLIKVHPEVTVRVALVARLEQDGSRPGRS